MFEPQSKEVINFAVGQPSTKDFPMKEIRAAVKEFAAVDDDELSMSLEYGYQAGACITVSLKGAMRLAHVDE